MISPYGEVYDPRSTLTFETNSTSGPRPTERDENGLSHQIKSPHRRRASPLTRNKSTPCSPVWLSSPNFGSLVDGSSFELKLDEEPIPIMLKDEDQIRLQR